MTFDPSLPEEGANVSRTHPLREAALLVVGVVAVALALALGIGVAVDWIVPRIPPRVEAAAFSDWFARATLSGEDSAAREGAVYELLQRLTRHRPDSPYAFRVLVWEESEPNALALPGGSIAVTTGLLDRVTSENELAFVLGHELGHFHNRDHLRGLGRGMVFSLILVAVGLAGGGGAAELAVAAGRFAQRGFDREQERRADRFGLELIVAEYGHTAGAAELFDHLPEPEGFEREVAGYLSTHPLHDDRVDALHAVARAADWPEQGQRVSLAPALRPR
jgi:predicted Zn-dependent protease